MKSLSYDNNLMLFVVDLNSVVPTHTHTHTHTDIITSKTGAGTAGF